METRPKVFKNKFPLHRRHTTSALRTPIAWCGLKKLLFLVIRITSSMQHSVIEHNHVVESSWNVMAHGDAREGKWRGNWRMEWIASILHTTSKHGVSSITTADAHTSAASSRLNWRPCRFKWTRPFRRNMKSGFCACAITFQNAVYINHC